MNFNRHVLVAVALAVASTGQSLWAQAAVERLQGNTANVSIASAR